MMMIAAIHCMVELNKQLVTHNTSLVVNLVIFNLKSKNKMNGQF